MLGIVSPTSCPIRGAGQNKRWSDFGETLSNFPGVQLAPKRRITRTVIRSDAHHGSYTPGSLIIPASQRRASQCAAGRRLASVVALLFCLMFLMPGCGDGTSDEGSVPADPSTAGGLAATVDSETTVMRELVDPASDITLVLTASPRNVPTTGSVNLTLVIERPASLMPASNVRRAIEAGLADGWEVDEVDRATVAIEVADEQTGHGSENAVSEEEEEAKSAPVVLREQDRYRFELTPFVPGPETLGPFALSYQERMTSAENNGPQGTDPAPVVLEIQPFEIEVRSALAELDPDAQTSAEGDASAEAPSVAEAMTPADLRDPVAPPPATLPAWMWWTIVGGVLGFFALMVAIIWLAARASRREPEPVVRHRTADEIAFASLNDLDRARVLDAPDGPAIFVDRAANILRQYVEDRFGLRAPELTTEEFLEEARGSSAFEPGDLVLFEQFLQKSDLVKFAAVSASRSEATDAAQLVRAFVERTRFNAAGRATVIAFDADNQRIGRLAPGDAEMRDLHQMTSDIGASDAAQSHHAGTWKDSDHQSVSPVIEPGEPGSKSPGVTGNGDEREIVTSEQHDRREGDHHVSV